MVKPKETAKEHKVFSRLIDFLNKEHQKIVWGRYCWKDGGIYQDERLKGHLDNEFPITKYFSRLDNEEIELGFCIWWNQIPSSVFNLRFSKWAQLGLSPKPEDIVLSYNNPYSEEKSTRPEIPIYQARYRVLFVEHFDEARTAMKDFVDRGTEFAQYFTGMQDQSKEQFFKLVEKFKSFQNQEEIVRIG
jgi:hypothetical protein